MAERVRSMPQGGDLSPPAIGVGTLFEGASRLNQSYIEALSAFESRLYAGPGSTSYFTSISDPQERAFCLPHSLLIKLTQSLKQGSLDVTMPTIGQCFAWFSRSGASMPVMRAMCYDILNTMLKTASELNLATLSREIPPMAAFSSLEELERGFVRLASCICTGIESLEKTKERSLLDQVLTFINGRYADHTLSLETISQEHGISASHLSRSFKEKTGMNFTAYVWQKRVEEAKRQLDATADPLRDIIQRVGYMDAPSFIRKFKKETGLTPGQYRGRGAGGVQG